MTRLKDLIKNNIFEVCCESMQQIIDKEYIDITVNGKLYFNLSEVNYPMDADDIYEIELKFCSFCGLPFLDSDTIKKAWLELKEKNREDRNV